MKNYKVYCYSTVECTIERTDEDCGEYWDDGGSGTYYVTSNFTTAKKLLIQLTKDYLDQWQTTIKYVRSMRNKDIPSY